MTTASSFNGTWQRHPWLAAVEAAPGREVRALLRGTADIYPYNGAEADDAASMLLFGLPADDAAIIAFDAGCLEVVESLRTALSAATDDAYKFAALLTCRLLAVIRRVEPPQTAAALHQRYSHWFEIFADAVFDQGLDLRRDFWLTLALTQDLAPKTLEPRRLMSHWFDVWAEAGRFGSYADYYYDVGQLGLRRLPLNDDHSANEEAVCHGFGRWAMRQRPDRKTFEARWEEIEAIYPRHPDFWPPLVQDVIAAQEDALSVASDKKMTTFPAARWWREMLDMAVPAKKSLPARSTRRRDIEPPAPQRREGILASIDTPISALRPSITTLMAEHSRYADATGDVYFLIRTACNVGMKLIKGRHSDQKERGEQAVALARKAMDYEPANPYAWSLWRNGLRESGSLAAAETLGWEAIRRFPEDAQWRNELATLLSEQLYRPVEAEALLRDTITLFPHDATARTQLAKEIARQPERHGEAEEVLREILALFPTNPHTYTQLAALLADLKGDSAAALAVLDQAVRANAADEVTATLRRRIVSGGRPHQQAQPKQHQRPGIYAAIDDSELPFPAALARRALFHVETATPAGRDDALAEVQRVLQAHPGLAYHRYLSERAGLSQGERVGAGETAVALAFALAMHGNAAPAFQALAARVQGVDAQLVRAGLVLIQGGADLPPVDTSEGFDFSGTAHRLSVLRQSLQDGAKIAANDNMMRQLRLLGDFAASRLSLAA